MFFLTPLLFGILLLSYILTQPRVETYQKADVVILVLSGWLLALGVGGLFGMVKRPGE
jgi:hypothetical protein